MDYTENPTSCIPREVPRDFATLKQGTSKMADIGTEEILEFMKSGARRPLSFRELVKSFNVPRSDRNRFKSTIKKMVDEGMLVKIRGARYGLPTRMNLVTGELTCHPDGFGFVIPEEGGEDVFIGPRKLRGAMHGDRVVARVEGYKRGGRREGSIIRVLERAHKEVVGRFKKVRGASFVIPANERILDDIVIPPRNTMGARDGTMVVARITRWPASHQSALGKIVEIIGDPEDPDVEVEVIARKYGLPHRFPPGVLHEVESVAMEVRPGELRGRTDLRDRRIFTIDGESAKDFDDAVGIERTPKGYRLFVSIADVSHYVKEGSLLDAEAYERGTSVYFPDRSIPMLPEALSNGICSLNPKVDRLTLTAELEFDRRGRPVGRRFYESVIRSKERLTYTNVKKVLSGEDEELEKRYSHILEDLRTMEELALKLNRRRMEEGSIDFDLPEPQIIIDIEGRVEDIVKSERNIAHRMIEEFMLTANRAVAELFSSRGWPFLYRVHERPDEESIAEFREFIAGFGYHMKGKVTPKSFQRILESVEGRPEERLINHVLLRSMKQAVYSDENTGHFGLAFKDYTHFTSPIRRFPDLVVHRLLKRFLKRRYNEKERERMQKLLPEIAAHASRRERKAMEAEREIVDLKKAQFMLDKVGEVYGGFISGVTSFGFFVELKDYYVEGLVHVTTLTDDFYTYVEKEHSLVGETTNRRFRLGSEVMVRIAHVDIERRRIDMEIEEPPGGARAKRTRRRRK